MKIRHLPWVLLLAAATSVDVKAADDSPGAQARAAGVERCLDRVEQLGVLATARTSYGSRASWHRDDGDGHLFQSLLALRYPDGHSAAVMTAAPNPDGCDASMVSILWLPESCPALREGVLSDWAFAGDMAGLAVVQNADSGVESLLMPAGDGCIAIISEVVYAEDSLNRS